MQPLVENSVKHGMRAEGVLHVTLSASCRDGWLNIDITDDGVGISEKRLPHVLEPGFGKGLGIALKNVDDRLKGHFGGGSGLTIDSTEGVGTRVIIRIRLEDGESCAGGA